MYIVVPILIFDRVIDSIILARISNQVINSIEIRILLKLLIVYIYYKIYKMTMSIIFRKLHFNLKKEWISYLTLNGWKIGYYKRLLPWINILNRFNSSFFKAMDLLGEFYNLLHKISIYALIFLFYFISCSLVCAHYQESIFGFNVWKSEILHNYAKNFNIELFNLIAFLVYSFILTSFTLFVLGSFFAFISIRLLQCMFPLTKRIADASDIPISFIKKAIEEMESFNFLDNFEQKQDKKDQITQLISYALEFIKVDNGNKDPGYTNLCYILYAGHLSKAAQNDVLFRANSLYKKMDELCVKINNMNCPDDKILILQDLKMYIKVIENRDLSKIEGIPYTIKESNLPTLIVESITFIKKIVL
jgi:hypothetical protein